MRYFAKIETDNVVSQIITLDDAVENPQDFIASLGIEGTWLESFEDGGERVNMASVGGTYDPVRNMFIQSQPEGDFEINLVFDEETGRWNPEEPNA